MYPDDRFHIIHDDREYDIFGHGGMLFWFASSVFFFVVSDSRSHSGAALEMNQKYRDFKSKVWYRVRSEIRTAS